MAEEGVGSTDEGKNSRNTVVVIGTQAEKKIDNALHQGKGMSLCIMHVYAWPGVHVSKGATLVNSDLIVLVTDE